MELSDEFTGTAYRRLADKQLPLTGNAFPDPDLFSAVGSPDGGAESETFCTQPDQFAGRGIAERTEQTQESDAFQSVAFSGSVGAVKYYLLMRKRQFPASEIAEIGEFKFFNNHFGLLFPQRHDDVDKAFTGFQRHRGQRIIKFDFDHFGIGVAERIGEENRVE